MSYRTSRQPETRNMLPPSIIATLVAPLHRRRIRRMLVTAALATAVMPSLAAAQPAAPRPNVVLVIADDLGYGDLGSYGAPDIATPHLDRLAREGVRLTDFYANAPVCTPTRAALITGRYQQRVLLERPLGGGASQGLPVTGRSLPQLLKSAGYATALVGKWHLGERPEFHPNRHGFDYFFGYLGGLIDWYTHTRGDGQHDLWENGARVHHTGYFQHEVTRRTVEFVRQNAGRPFFVEVAYGAPHWPFQSPRRASIARDNARLLRASDAEAPTRQDYAEIVEDVDAGVGQILAELDRLGIAGRTLVIFMSDNGGEWLSRNAPLFHRKDRLWEGGIRVPALFRWPAMLPAGATSRQPGMTMDVTATLLAAAGADVSALRLDGIDLLPVLRGDALERPRALFWRNSAAGSTQRAVRQGDWKLLVDGPQEFLFNLRDDIGERNDLAAANADRVRGLKALLDAWERDADAEAKPRAPAGVLSAPVRRDPP
jgi:arylsulfatase A-like enzyme